MNADPGAAPASVLAGGLSGLWQHHGEALLRLLPKVATAVLVVLLAQSLAHLSWRLVPLPASPAPVPDQPRAVAAGGVARNSPERQAAEVARLHLFGERGAAPAAVPRPVADAPETKLDLTLYGVFVEGRGEEGSAIIGKPGSSQRLYHVGEEVADGRSLAAVYPDRVILERDGGRETLRFPRRVAAKAGPATGPAAGRGGLGTVFGAPSRDLSEFRDLFGNSPDRILDHLRFLPVRAGGRLKGFRILPQGDRRLYNKLGLQPADIVVGVNGTPLTDEQQALAIVDQLRDAAAISLEVERRGQRRTLELTLD